MRRSLLLYILTISSISVYSQININIGVDTTTVKSKSVIHFLTKYFSDFKENNEVNYSEYFFQEDIKNTHYPDKIAFGLLGNVTNYSLGTPYLLALDVKTDTVKAKVLFATVDSSMNLQTNFIANYYIRYNKQNCRFLITQNIETENWQVKKVRNITFHFPPYHLFNSQKAQALIDSTISLEKNWQLTPLDIHYYFANTNQEIQKIKGFDFNFYMARSEYPQGLAYEKDKTIYCSGQGENNFHEMVHLYLNPLYPNTPLKEGIATFYGGSINKSYKKDLIRLSNYINKHPQINIANHSEFYYMDEQTIPKYVIQAFICHLVYKNKGLQGLKSMLKIDSLDDIYRIEFGIEPENQNEFLRREIKKYISKI